MHINQVVNVTRSIMKTIQYRKFLQLSSFLLHINPNRIDTRVKKESPRIGKKDT